MSNTKSIANNKKVNQNERVYIKLGERIKELRVNEDYSREDLASLLEVSVGYLSLLERGQRGGSKELLVQLEKIFELEPNTLASLRVKNLQNNEPVLKGNESDHKKLQVRNNSRPTVQYPDYVSKLVEELLSFDEEYAKEKVNHFTQELRNDYVNQLPLYEKGDVTEYLLNIKQEWLKRKISEEVFQAKFLEGCIHTAEQKQYFVVEYDEISLRFNLQESDQQEIPSLENHLGPCSLSYVTKSQIPSLQKKKMTCTLWFNPWVSMETMYKYLETNDPTIKDLVVFDQRLQWYIREQPSLGVLK